MKRKPDFDNGVVFNRIMKTAKKFGVLYIKRSRIRTSLTQERGGAGQPFTVLKI